MQTDPIQEWQRLTQHYREMSDEELRELAADFSDLTETAQQALRSEMRGRGLGDLEAAGQVPQAACAAPPVAFTTRRTSAAEPIVEQTATPFAFVGQDPEIVPGGPETDEKDDGPHEYTWKTLLCECDTSGEAEQLKEVLRRAGIESWFTFGGYTTSFVPSISRSLLIGGIHVLVAADQLDQARLVAARPTPQEIVEESETKVPEFTPPSCPKCGAEDPVLEGVDPSNTWRCEQCGEQWTEATATSSEGTPEAGQSPL